MTVKKTKMKESMDTYKIKKENRQITTLKACDVFIEYYSRTKTLLLKLIVIFHHDMKPITYLIRKTDTLISLHFGFNVIIICTFISFSWDSHYNRFEKVQVNANSTV